MFPQNHQMGMIDRVMMYQHNKKVFFLFVSFYSVTYEQNTSVSNASNVASDQYGKLFDIQLLALV